MIREKNFQPVYTRNPRLVGCDKKGAFDGIHVFIPPNSRAYVTNQSYTTGISKSKLTRNSHTSFKSTNSTPASILSIHPAIAKAWVTFSGVSGEVYEGFNILSVHKRTVGSYSIAFIIPMANTTYVPIVIAEGFNVQALPTLLKTHTLEIETKIFEQNTRTFAHDSHTVHVVVFGSLHSSYL